MEIGNQKIAAKNGLLVSEQRVYQPQAEIEYASDLKGLQSNDEFQIGSNIGGDNIITNHQPKVYFMVYVLGTHDYF